MITRLEPAGPVAGFVTMTPATLPDNAFATLFSRTSRRSSPPTSVTEYPTARSLRSMPPAVTTTSSKRPVSSSRAMVISSRPSMAMVWLTKPMKVTERDASGLDTSSENDPSTSAAVPFKVPVSTTEAPGNGELSTAETTVPWTE